MIIIGRQFSDCRWNDHLKQKMGWIWNFSHLQKRARASERERESNLLPASKISLKIAVFYSPEPQLRPPRPLKPTPLQRVKISFWKSVKWTLRITSSGLFFCSRSRGQRNDDDDDDEEQMSKSAFYKQRVDEQVSEIKVWAGRWGVCALWRRVSGDWTHPENTWRCKEKCHSTADLLFYRIGFNQTRKSVFCITKQLNLNQSKSSTDTSP